MLWATLFAAATVLSHPAMASFLAYSGLVFLFAHGHHGPPCAARRRPAGTACSRPLAAHGGQLSRPVALVASGGSGGEPVLTLESLTLVITNEPFFPVLGALAALGALACLRQRQAWLPAWLAVMVPLDARSPLATASVPLALLAGSARATCCCRCSRASQSSRSRR